jgi:galactonate dehydratase
MEGIDAVRLARAIAPHDPMFLEEPLRPGHKPAWGQMKAKMDIPLATGEALYDRHEFLALLAAGGADIVQPDIAVVGGLTEIRRIAEVADAHFVPVAPHNPMGPLATAHNLHFAAALPNFKILEYKVCRDVPWITDPYLPVDGHLELRPDRPGWGVEIDERALSVDEYSHWSRDVLVKPDGATSYA